MSQKVFKREDGTVCVMTINDMPSLTEQQFAEDCDVNVILKRILRVPTVLQAFQRGELDSTTGTYGDFSSMPSYQEALQQVIDANAKFNELPAEIRLKFNNDPQRLIDYLGDKNNLEESYKIGLRIKPKVEPNYSKELADEMRELHKTIKNPKKKKEESD